MTANDNDEADDKFVFELLCVDTYNTSKIQTPEQFAYSLLANGNLWDDEDPRFDKKTCIIEDNLFTVEVNSVDTKGAADFVKQKSFDILVKGDYEATEKVRLPILEHIRKQDFPLIYILTDEVSELIAREIYPDINVLENRLRRYLIKFFITKLGSDWWKTTADSEMQKKTQLRKNNEKLFSRYVDNKAYLIDFGELGKIVYSQSSGFISKEDIIEKVMRLDPSEASIITLQTELQSNYTKFFKETFKDKGFQDKWTKLEEIRHKVAHNNLFTDDEVTTTQDLVEEVLQVIEEAEQKIDEIVFSEDEQVAIKETIFENLTSETEQSSPSSYSYHSPYKRITREELLDELEEQEDRFSIYDGYVGLLNFVRSHLGNMNYDFAASYELIEQLIEGGVIEKYFVTGSYGGPIPAIRLIKEVDDVEAEINVENNGDDYIELNIG